MTHGALPLRAILVGLALAALITPTRAVTFRATIEPFLIHAEPGQFARRIFRLTLDPDQPRTQFRARVQDWWRSEDGRRTFFAPPGTLDRSCGDWISLDPVEAAVDAGETLVVRLDVQVAPDAPSGGHWCMLTVEQVPDPLREPQRGAGLAFRAVVSTAIFAHVGAQDRRMEILDLDIRDDRAVVVVRNDGNTPVFVAGHVEFAREPGAVPLARPSIGRGVLLTAPIRTGVFAAPLPDADALPDGTYVVRALLDAGLDHYVGAERILEVRRRRQP